MRRTEAALHMTNIDLLAQKAQRLRLQRFSLAAVSYIIGGMMLLAVSMLGSDHIP